MKHMMLSLFIVVACIACSDESIQIDLEKAGSQENGTVFVDPNKDIYIEFENVENVENDLMVKEQMTVQKTIEEDEIASDDTMQVDKAPVDTAQLDITSVDTTPVDTVIVGEKPSEKLSEKELERSLQNITEIYEDKTTKEAINERVMELLKQRNEELQKRASNEVLAKDINDTSTTQGLNETSTTDNSADDALIKQLEASLSEIYDTDIMVNYGPEGSAIALKNRSTPLAVSKNNLKTTVDSIPGSTSFTKNSDDLGFSVDLSSDYLFKFDQDILTTKAKPALESILMLYKKYEGIDIAVAGYTDSKGSENYNVALSTRRANAVRQWFESKGIRSDVITSVGFGEAQAVAPNTKNNKDNPEGRLLNRRVNITIKTENIIH